MCRRNELSAIIGVLPTETRSFVDASSQPTDQAACCWLNGHIVQFLSIYKMERLRVESISKLGAAIKTDTLPERLSA